MGKGVQGAFFKKPIPDDVIRDGKVNGERTYARIPIRKLTREERLERLYNSKEFERLIESNLLVDLMDKFECFIGLDIAFPDEISEEWYMKSVDKIVDVEVPEAEVSWDESQVDNGLYDEMMSALDAAEEVNGVKSVKLSNGLRATLQEMPMYDAEICKRLTQETNKRDNNKKAWQEIEKEVECEKSARLF